MENAGVRYIPGEGVNENEKWHSSKLDAIFAFICGE